MGPGPDRDLLLDQHLDMHVFGLVCWAEAHTVSPHWGWQVLGFLHWPACLLVYLYISLYNYGQDFYKMEPYKYRLLYVALINMLTERKT